MRLKSCGVASRTPAKGKFWGKLRAKKAKKVKFEKNYNQKLQKKGGTLVKKRRPLRW